MTKEELWKTWADPSDWCEYMERGYSLEQTQKDFYEDLENYFDTELRRNTNEMSKALKNKTIRSNFIYLVSRFLKGDKEWIND